MWEALRQFLTDLSEGFGTRHRWLILPILLVLLYFVFLGIEHHIGWFYYSEMNNKISILERMHSLTENEILQNEHLLTIYKQIVSDISNNQITRFRFEGEASFLWKAISGGLIGFLIFIAALVSRMHTKKKRAAIIGSLLITVVSALIAVSLPTLGFPFVNYFGVPFMLLFALVVFTKTYMKRVKEKAEAVSCKSNMRSISSGMKMFKGQYKGLASDLAELTIVLSNATALSCPSCDKPYQLIVIEDNFSVVCPNEPSHGAINKYSHMNTLKTNRAAKGKDK